VSRAGRRFDEVASELDLLSDERNVDVDGLVVSFMKTYVAGEHH
jgi:hypothetical protein